MPRRYCNLNSALSKTLPLMISSPLITTPTAQHRYWNETFAGHAFYYGHEAGPVARRAVRYSLPAGDHGALEALDAGCGEGQDLAYLAGCGYRSTGLDFTTTGIEKTHRFLAGHGVAAAALEADLTTFDFVPWHKRFAIVLAVNALQFLGEAGPRVLDDLAACVAPGGILGISLFAPGELNQGRDELWLCSEAELVSRLAPRFAMIETASLRQWKGEAAQPFATAIARRKQEGSL